MSAERQLKVVIVGAGPGGLAAAIELRNHGFRDVTLLERAPRLGGTWFYNSYPGSACDVPSHLYSFSFAQRRDWTRLCSPQGEILDYLDEVARKHGVDRLLVPNTRVDSCVWEEDRAGWRVSASDGREWRADAVVIATGQLHRPGIPGLAGAESFAGHTFHSAAWDHDYSMKGRRVAVIGTGASAVQLIPEVAREAEQLYVVQRSGNWLLPRRNRAYPKPVRTAIRYVPGLQRFRRRFVYEYGEPLTAAIRHPHTLGRLAGYRSWAFMRWQLRGRPELRRRVWPDYTFGCKRVLFTSAYLPALRRE